MRKNIAIFFLMLVVMSCKHHKKASMTGEEKVDVGDFIAYFRPVGLPFNYSDSLLWKKEKDTFQISQQVFSQFVPDSILQSVFGKTGKPKIYAVGRNDAQQNISFLFVKTATADKKAFFIICMMKKQFTAALAALRPDQNSSTIQSVIVDRRYGITKNIIRKNSDGTINEGKDVYSFSPESKAFQLVMTDALDDKQTELVNPIDTLPRKNKWSADYGSGKMNLVSIRDGKHADKFVFFIHFEKNKGECIGELKGDGVMRTANTGEYRLGGDPCVLQFIFGASSVSLKEEEGCGSHRGIRCSFDGNFTKKKVKATVKKSK